MDCVCTFDGIPCIILNNNQNLKAIIENITIIDEKEIPIPIQVASFQHVVICRYIIDPEKEIQEEKKDANMIVNEIFI